MSSLEEVVANSSVRIPTEQSTVTIVAVSWHGDTVLEATFKREDGTLGQAMLYRDDEPAIQVEDARRWSFDADTDSVRITSEAYRISLAHLFDPYLAVRTSAIDPLPHQISAVYKEMLPRLPLRFVLADDPGAGKTVMAGLLIKEMMTRGDLTRCLVVCPGSLAEQWQDELSQKFNLNFKILTNDYFEAAVTGNAFNENNFCIARLDKLARDETTQMKLDQSRWDLIICDEAHKMSATVFGNEVKYTKRYQLGKKLGGLTENFLLMTATPHNGKPQDFQLFMALIDQDRFEGAAHNKPKNKKQSSQTNLFDTEQIDIRLPEKKIDVSDVMRRLVKEELLKFDGRPLFPERRAYTVNYSLSPAEAGLYAAVTDYVTEEFNRADQLDGKRKNSVGFALTILQRRLASSPEAIYQSLKRRRERLEARLAEVKMGKAVQDTWTPKVVDPDDYDEDDYTDEELEGLESEVSDTATAAATIEELTAEIGTLRLLERKANDVRTSGDDRKWNELSKVLQDKSKVFDENGQREKLIIFTEHKDTLLYLAGKIRSLLGSDEAVLTIQGGMLRDDRRSVEERFRQDKHVRILIATDAAGEGINLQRAHLMINYDLPWNPNRLEQRFGRIHRIGQTEVCHLWNLVSNETREGDVFTRLLNKLNEEKNALGGRVFDVLGQISFNDSPLRELLMEAIRYGDRPDVKARLNQEVDKALDTEELKKLLDRYALTKETMAESEVTEIREDMERMEARKLEPHFIEEFFIEALRGFSGRVVQRERGRYEVLDVPFAIRNQGTKIGYGNRVQAGYERICFAKEDSELQGYPPADLICPGHPLLDSLTSLLLEKGSGLLKQGCFFIDEENRSEAPRLLFYIESEIQDGVTLSNGNKRCVAKSVRFVEIEKDGHALSAGYAPYLDYNSPDEDEYDALEDYVASETWLQNNVESIAVNYAIEHITPEQLTSEKMRRESAADKTSRAVKERLTAEVRYWDKRAEDLRKKENEGKRNAKVTAKYAERRADELAHRMEVRLARIEQERCVTPVPPRVVGGALVVPRSYLNSLMGYEESQSSADKKAIELAGMKAVMAIEEALGNIPIDVSKQNVGWDIESRVNEETRNGGNCFKFIEVKGRAAGSTTVTLSRNEVLGAMNNPDKFILAIVEVDGRTTRATYIQQPFEQTLGSGELSGTFSINSLKENGQVLLEKEQTWQ